MSPEYYLSAIINFIGTIQSFIVDFGHTRFVFTLKLVGGFLTAVFLALVVLLIMKMKIIDGWFKTANTFLMTNAFPKRHMNKSWQKVVGRLNKNDEANLRLALIEADNLFDDLLKQMRLPGESMADRLKNVDSTQVPNIDEIWRAHKLRNIIVHNYEYPVTRGEIEFGVKAYEKALRTLELID